MSNYKSFVRHNRREDELIDFDSLRLHTSHMERCDKHHRKPRKLGGKKTSEHGRDNIISVPRYKHEAWHTLFATMTIQEIVDYMNDTWIDPDVKLVIIKRID